MKPTVEPKESRFRDSAGELSALHDQIDRGIESLVSGQPSPHFNSRLRARIAEDTSASRLTWRTWAPIAGCAFTLAALLFVLILRAPYGNSPLPDRNSATIVSPPRPAAPTPVSSPQNEPPRTAVHHPTHLRSNSHLDAQPSQPEVIVPPGEFAAVMQFADAVRSGRIDGPQLVAADERANAPMEIKSMEIAPLTPPPTDISQDASEDSSRP